MSQLIWQIVKGRSAFLKTQKDNKSNFSNDPSNVTSENRFRTSGLVRNNTVTLRTNPNAKEGSHYPLQIVSGLGGTSGARTSALKGGKKGKSNAKGYLYNAQRINAAAAANGTRDGIRRAALARWSKLTQANKPPRTQRERESR